jgi:hypothetical protein
MRHRFLHGAALATALLITTVGTVSAHPANDQTLTFALHCPGHEWVASFNGGPSAFHITDPATTPPVWSLFIWKEIAYVTPDGQSGTIERGVQGFSGAPTVTCTYIGAASGNAYTVTGFYTPAG